MRIQLLKGARGTRYNILYTLFNTYKQVPTQVSVLCFPISSAGDGCFSFDEFVEIVSNMGKTSSTTAEEEEKELRDAFRVSVYIIIRKSSAGSVSRTFVSMIQAPSILYTLHNYYV